MIILSIDPGNIESAYCFIEKDNLKPMQFAKSKNESVLDVVLNGWYDILVIERIEAFGMVVGKSVFETCEWVGRFTQAAQVPGRPVGYIYRKEERLHICRDSKAKDVNIRRALIDRFAKHDLKNGKGTKKNPDWFYGFKADCWSAYAVGLTFIETKDQDEANQKT